MRTNTNTQSNQQSRQMPHMQMTNRLRTIANNSTQTTTSPINNNRQSNNSPSPNNNPSILQLYHERKYRNQTSFINTNQNPFLPDSFPFLHPSFGSKRTDTNQQRPLNSNPRPNDDSSIDQLQLLTFDDLFSGFQNTLRNNDTNPRLNNGFIDNDNQSDSWDFDDDNKQKKMKEAIMKSLLEFYIKDLANLDEEKTHCCICLSVFTTDIKVVSLPCLHLYHKDCIVDWFENDNTCPLCKMVINENSFK